MAETVSTVGWGERGDEFCKNVVGRLNSLYESGDGNRKHIIGGGDIAAIELVYVDSDECRFKVTLREGQKSMQFEGDRGIIDEQEEFAVIALKEATLNEPKTIDVSSVDSNSNSYTWSIVSPATFKDEMKGRKIAKYDNVAEHHSQFAKSRSVPTAWPPALPASEPMPPPPQEEELRTDPLDDDASSAIEETYELVKTLLTHESATSKITDGKLRQGILDYMNTYNSLPPDAPVEKLLPHVLNKLQPLELQRLHRLTKELDPGALWLLLIFSEQQKGRSLNNAIAEAVKASETLTNAVHTLEALQESFRNVSAQNVRAQEELGKISMLGNERQDQIATLTKQIKEQAAAAKAAATEAEKEKAQAVTAAVAVAKTEAEKEKKAAVEAAEAAAAEATEAKAKEVASIIKAAQDKARIAVESSERAIASAREAEENAKRAANDKSAAVTAEAAAQATEAAAKATEAAEQTRDASEAVAKAAAKTKPLSNVNNPYHAKILNNFGAPSSQERNPTCEPPDTERECVGDAPSLGTL